MTNYISRFRKNPRKLKNQRMNTLTIANFWEICFQCIIFSFAGQSWSMVQGVSVFEDFLQNPPYLIETFDMEDVYFISHVEFDVSVYLDISSFY